MNDDLQDLLTRCTFRVGGSKPGTAFAVSSTLLVTCRHVVDDVGLGGVVELRQKGVDAPVAARVALLVPGPDEVNLDHTEPTAEDLWPDFALLEVEEADALSVAVMLDATQPAQGDTVYVAGYPEGKFLSFAFPDYTVGSKRDSDDAGNEYTKISAESVDHGLSGAAVMTSAGTICGYVNSTRLSDSLIGGYFIPLTAVMDKVGQVRDLHSVPAAEASAWIELIGAEALGAMHRTEDGARTDAERIAPEKLDLHFAATTQDDHGSRLWTIAQGGTGVSATRTLLQLGSDFPDSLFDALDNWARRSELATEAQVDLLGGVLERVIMPDEIKAEIDRLDRREIPLVRLRADAADARTAIPWEYTTGLGTDGTLAFSRFIDTEKEWIPPRDSLRVLFIVNDVEGVKAKDVLAELRKEGKGEEVRRILAAHSFPRMNFEILQTPSLEAFSQKLRAPGGWDVVHIITSASSSGALVLPNRVINWNTVSAMLVASQARAVVLQLASLRFDAPAPLSGFLGLLSEQSTIDARGSAGTVVSGVRALVLSQHIATLEHVTQFSNVFYGALDRGLSVERAVQESRADLRQLRPPSPIDQEREDFAAFGAVAVVTTAEGDIRLLAPERNEESDSTQHETAHDQGAGRNVSGKARSLQSPSATPRAAVKTGAVR